MLKVRIKEKGVVLGKRMFSMTDTGKISMIHTDSGEQDVSKLPMSDVIKQLKDGMQIVCSPCVSAEPSCTIELDRSVYDMSSVSSAPRLNPLG